MTPHEVQFPPPPDNGWGIGPFVLAVVAVAFVGALLLTGV